MRNQRRVCVVVAMLFCSLSAHAQSSVTLYGVIDEGLDITSNAGGHTGYQMVSGDSWGSRWGIKGTEDLGGGVSAIFRLESGFDVNSGHLAQGGRMFGRTAVVGMQSNQWGTLTLGRQYDPGLEMWGMNFTAASGTIGDLIGHPFDNDNSDWSFRVNNSAKYTSPVYKGFQTELMYAFSNSTSFANNRFYGAGLTYSVGPFSSAIAYTNATNPGATTAGALTGDQSFTASNQKNLDAGIKWTFANGANIAFAYSHTNVANPTANLYVADIGTVPWNSWKFDNFELNGTYFINPQLSVIAAYLYTLGHLNSATTEYSSHWNQVALMLNYDLSKRTSVYVQGAYLRVTSHTGTGLDDANIIYSSGPSSNDHQMEFRIALLHKF